MTMSISTRQTGTEPNATTRCARSHAARGRAGARAARSRPRHDRAPTAAMSTSRTPVTIALGNCQARRSSIRSSIGDGVAASPDSNHLENSSRSSARLVLAGGEPSEVTTPVKPWRASSALLEIRGDHHGQQSADDNAQQAEASVGPPLERAGAGTVGSRSPVLPPAEGGEEQQCHEEAATDDHQRRVVGGVVVEESVERRVVVEPDPSSSVRVAWRSPSGVGGTGGVGVVMGSSSARPTERPSRSVPRWP